MQRRVLGVLMAGALLLVGCSDTLNEDETTRDDAGEITEGGEVGAFRLQTGDCINDPGVTDDIQSLQAVPCEDPHDWQVFATFDLEDPGSFPGDAAVEELGGEGCFERFEGFVGLSYELSVFDFTFLAPSAETWEQVDDREVVCLLFDPSGPVTGTLEGANR